jgi:glycerophosphoryl diester phosphodiesterase
MAAIGAWTATQAADYREHLPRAQILNSQGVPPNWSIDLIVTARAQGFAGFELSSENVPVGFVEAAHAHGMVVYVYTVNTAAEMRALIKRGVDGIETDVPELLIHLLRDRTPRTP